MLQVYLKNVYGELVQYETGTRRILDNYQAIAFMYFDLR